MCIRDRFNWLARTNPKVVNIFKRLWNTDELVTSFDGCCYYPSDYKGDDVYWTHTDQSSYKKGRHCLQSFLSLTNNSERTLLVYKGSHLLHEHYFKTLNIDAPRDWCVLDKNYVNNLENKKVYVKVCAGDLVIWDSNIYIVEGVFDHIVVPNSIPMLGKVMSENLFIRLVKKAECKVIILLDSDAHNDAIKLYKRLNSTKLMNRVMIIKLPEGYDISDINQKLGKKGVIDILTTAKKIKESLL